jgi:hypothetical protein
MSTQYYAAEATRNPIWLFQISHHRNDDDGEITTEWDTETVFSSREKAERYGEQNSHNFGKKNKGWRVYSVCCKDDALARAMAGLRPDLIDEWSTRIENGPAATGPSMRE